MAYSLVVPDLSEIKMLKYILNIDSADNPILWLYSSCGHNDEVPDESSVIGDFDLITAPTIISPVLGYVELDPLQWDISTINGVGVAEYPTQIFTLAPGTIIYGYVITNNASDFLLWAQRCFFAPVTITATALTFSVTPRFNASSTN
jgi:hypothetical protein